MSKIFSQRERPKKIVITGGVPQALEGVTHTYCFGLKI
jgi:hypothetical protein